jgi:hypothetical protein
MLKNTILNQICLYDGFYHYENHTVMELLTYISLGIQCFFAFDQRYLGDEGIKRLAREWCKLLKVEDAEWLVTYGLTSRCVESAICFSLTVDLLKDIIAGAPRTSICDLATTE